MDAWKERMRESSVEGGEQERKRKNEKREGT